MIPTPSKPTLKKYGLSEEEWRAILDGQGGVCAICRLEPKTGRMVTDHEHVKNYKKLPPEQRKLYVRGLCCWWCNKTFLGRGITIERSKSVTRYLETYGVRRLQLTGQPANVKTT